MDVIKIETSPPKTELKGVKWQAILSIPEFVDYNG